MKHHDFISIQRLYEKVVFYSCCMRLFYKWQSSKNHCLPSLEQIIPRSFYTNILPIQFFDPILLFTQITHISLDRELCILTV